MYKYSKAA